jgi:L-threonylcarbamoyladenylate synthase
MGKTKNPYWDTSIPIKCNNLPMSSASKVNESSIERAATILKNGGLVAFPTETVYGLGADASNKAAVERIYHVKGRPKNHPLIVHIASMQNLDKWAQEIPKFASQLAWKFWPGPMTLILPRTKMAKDFITGHQECVGVRIPANDIARKILESFEEKGGFGIVAPSANRFGAVSPTTFKAVETELSNFLNKEDLIIDGGQSLIGIESTIIDCTKTNPIILRPGSITREEIENLLNVKVVYSSINNSIRASGSYKSHYAPKAKVFLSGDASPGDGFIALSNIPTPKGAIRLIAPGSEEEFAKNLYNAFRLADEKEINKIYVTLPSEIGIGFAIIDRLRRASQAQHK